MVLVNEMLKAEKLPLYMLEGLAKIIAPITPFIASEFYQALGHTDLIDFSTWPTYDEEKISFKPVTYAIQVNGKLRAKYDFKKDATSEELEELKKIVLTLDNVKTYVEGKEIIKMIVVPNKIISIVVK